MKKKRPDGVVPDPATMAQILWNSPEFQKTFDDTIEQRAEARAMELLTKNYIPAVHKQCEDWARGFVQDAVALVGAHVRPVIERAIEVLEQVSAPAAAPSRGVILEQTLGGVARARPPRQSVRDEPELVHRLANVLPEDERARLSQEIIRQLQGGLPH